MYKRKRERMNSAEQNEKKGSYISHLLSNRTLFYVKEAAYLPLEKLIEATISSFDITTNTSYYRLFNFSEQVTWMYKQL